MIDMTDEMKTMVSAIRENRLVGRGSCMTIDECYDDSELVQALTEEHCTTVEGAIKWAVEMSDLHVEQMLNCRFGDDDDVELKISAEWEERKRNQSL